jgi:hypothetical protein
MEKYSQTQDAHAHANRQTDVYNPQELPKSVDLSHHLSDLAKARQPSPLKTLFKYLGQPNMLALAGGEPPRTVYSNSRVVVYRH